MEINGMIIDTNIIYGESDDDEYNLATYLHIGDWDSAFILNEYVMTISNTMIEQSIGNHMIVNHNNLKVHNLTSSKQLNPLT